MKITIIFKTLRILLAVQILSSVLTPGSLWACACGCGVFEVGTSSMLPTHPGGLVSLEYDYMDQNKDWNGKKRGTDDNNADKQIRTNFFTAEIQYMFDRKWGIMADLPYTDRYFKTDDMPGIDGHKHAAVGDIRVQGIYAGFSEDMSTGVTFGIKLPTGDYTYPNFDRDTAIGSGSTDALLGAYHFGRLPIDAWNWFVNFKADLPVLISGGYRPGSEVDAALGAYYDRWNVGGVKVAPLAQLVASHRWRDAGILSNSPNSGYERVLATPGLEVDTTRYRIYGGVGFPIYQYVNGDQLVASQLYQLNIGYAF